MRISDLINYLKLVEKEHGNIDVYHGYESLKISLTPDMITVVKLKATKDEKIPSKISCVLGYID